MALDVKYLRGSAEQYEAYLRAGKIIPTNFYLIDSKNLYLGTIKLSNAEDIQLAINPLELTIANNSNEILQLKQKVEELEVGSDIELANKIETLELKVELQETDITTLKTDIITLKSITSGIGGEEEPPTIMAAIDNAKTEIITYVDEALSWQTME